MTQYLPRLNLTMLVDPLYGAIAAGVITFLVKFIDNKLLTCNSESFSIVRYLKASLYVGGMVGLALYLCNNTNILRGGGNGGGAGCYASTSERYLQGLGENMLAGMHI